MIYYDYMYEEWTDDEDFHVAMSPEGGNEYLDMTFKTEEEFWKWYNGE